MATEQKVNDHLLMVCGKTATGKTASLMNIRDQPKWIYANCESGKRTPFKSNFMPGANGRPGIIITDPLQVPGVFDFAETKPEVEGIIVDSQTFLMDMYESRYVANSTNGQKAWGEFALFFKDLMLEKVAASSKNVIFTAHTADTYNDKELVMETKIPVKGSLKGNGIESYFSVIVTSKRMTLTALADFKNDLLHITPDDLALGYKYVFQTKVTADTIGERTRGPMGMWSNAETYIDNDVQQVMDRLDEYYA